MKRNALGALMTLIVAFVIATPVVNAQSQKILTANVPFAFNAAGKQLSAGEYDVRGVGDRATLIETRDGHDKVLTICPYAGPSKAGETKLVFHKIGSSYFLAQILTSARDQGLNVPESKAEKEMLSANAQNGGGGVETVIVALR
jgi:hypothetical protein